MNTRGVQNAQMQGSQGSLATPEAGEWPWILMAEGDSHPQGLARI
ncbi:MAG TPA: hypothetical protein VMU95_22905 [Trebonia sp.]|nr:hypothetical protein [Trebonia sp.]